MRFFDFLIAQKSSETPTKFEATVEMATIDLIQGTETHPRNVLTKA